jgi:hypothetical protein
MIAAGVKSPAKTVLIKVFFANQSADEIAELVYANCREFYAMSGYNPRPSNKAFREGLVNAILSSTELLRIKTALRSTLVSWSDHIVHEVVPLINPAGQKSPVAVRLEEDISKPYDLSEDAIYRMLENACGRG